MNSYFIIYLIVVAVCLIILNIEIYLEEKSWMLHELFEESDFEGWQKLVLVPLFVIILATSPLLLIVRFYYAHINKSELYKPIPNCFADCNIDEKVESILFHSERKYDFAYVGNCAFQPDENEIIFVDRRQNDALKTFMAEKKEEFDRFLWQHSLKYADLPELVDKIANYGAAIFNYYDPMNAGKFQMKDHIADTMLAGLIGKDATDKLTTGFLHFNSNAKRYTFFEVLPNEEVDYTTQISWYIKCIEQSNNCIRYRRVKKEDLPVEEQNDFTLNEDIQNIVDELKEKIAKLQASGVSDFFIRQIVMQQTSNAFQPSHLKVTKNYEIILTDFNDLVIELTPLAKAVYLLFLKHPEGIYLKEIEDYKDELSTLYNRITGRTDADKIKKTLKDLVDPTKNRLNENCTRIREAFICHFEDNMAKNYYIQGPWREKKKIALPRELVVWENEAK